eukprot:gene28968-2578_t
MLDTVTVTVTKINGESFGIGLQDYYGGSRVHVLVPGGAGASAGLQAGDVVVAIDGLPMGGQLHGVVAGAMRGKDTVTLELLRSPRPPATPPTTLPGVGVSAHAAAAEVGDGRATPPTAAAHPAALAWLYVDETVACDVEKVAAKWGNTSQFKCSEDDFYARWMAFQGITEVKVTPWTAKGTRTLHLRLPKSPTSSSCLATHLEEHSVRQPGSLHVFDMKQAAPKLPF